MYTDSKNNCWLHIHANMIHGCEDMYTGFHLPQFSAVYDVLRRKMDLVSMLNNWVLLDFGKVSVELFDELESSIDETVRVH